jgi:mRNA interferase MazF
MQRGEVWFAATPGGDRPVLVITRDPVAVRIGSELVLTAAQDGVPSDCVVNFDNIHTVSRSAFRRPVTQLSPGRITQACRALRDATGC